MPKDCPACGVTNTDTAILCDCGWSFAEGRSLRPIVIDQWEVDRALDEIDNVKRPSVFMKIVKWTAIVILGIAAAASGGFVGVGAFVVTLAALKYLRQPTAQPPV